MKSTIRLGERLSLSVEPNAAGTLTMSLFLDKRAPLPDFILGLNRDQAEALVFGIEAALESAMPLPSMGELAKV